MRGDQAPHHYTEGQWPYEVTAKPDAPPGVHYSIVLARALDGAAAGRGLSHRAISRLAELNQAAVGRIVRGEVYPDLATVARLEHALQVDLLPVERRRVPPGTSRGPADEEAGTRKV